MSRMSRSLVAASTVALALAGGVAYAAAQNDADAVRHVHAGQSIQAAIDAARPGTTIVVAAGTYRENLSLRHDGITLRGAGDGPDGTVLLPPATPHPSDCNEEGEVTGICVAGVFTQGQDQLGAPVRDTSVSGFRVRGFTRFGVVVYNAVGATVANVDVGSSGHFGIAAIEARGVRLQGDRSHDNGEAGFYVVDAGDTGDVITGNAAYGNTRGEGVGMFLRDASHGLVAQNRIEGNCGGLLVADTASPRAAAGWTIRDNVVRANTAACTPTDDVPVALSGYGVALLGTSSTTASGNRVEGNVPSGDTVAAGGIVVASAQVAGGPDPQRTVVTGNILSGNAPADLVTDGSGAGNRLGGNRCGTSLPDGLCTPAAAPRG